MEWGVSVTPWPLLPQGKTRYPLYRRLGGPQGRSRQVRKISPPTGIWSPDRPARSQSLYRLSYPGPQNCEWPWINLFVTICDWFLEGFTGCGLWHTKQTFGEELWLIQNKFTGFKAVSLHVASGRDNSRENLKILTLPMLHTTPG